MAGISEARSVNMKQFKGLLQNVSPEVAVCVRGKHAVGKSEGVYQAAAEHRHDLYKDPKVCARVVEAFGGAIKTVNGRVTEWKYEYGIPIVERRLSQMTEGDIIGLPFQHGEDVFDEETGERISFASTQFKPCDWLITAVEFPVMLFLDERNRAIEGVKQAVFQLTDSKAFYGVHLHGETRVVIAENVGDEYQIQACDPAEVSRCATVTLQPSEKDFLDYIKTRCHPILHEFLSVNNNHIENHGVFEPNKKYPDRRSWFKLDRELQRLGWYEKGEKGSMSVLVGAFVGNEATAPFVDYVLEHNRQVSAEDILKDWEKAKKRLKGNGSLSADKYMACCSKLDTWLKKNNLNDDQVYELARFMYDTTPEVCMSIYSTLTSGDMKDLLKVHPYVKDLIVFNASGDEDGDGKVKTAPILPPKKASTVETPKKTIKRGGKK